MIDGASTKPFGFMRFEPGPGMGGHCLPVDPFYFAFKARELDFYPEFIELAGKINQAQPQFCVDRIEKALNSVRKPSTALGSWFSASATRRGRKNARRRRCRSSAAARPWWGPRPTTIPMSPPLESSVLSADLEAEIAAADLVAVVTAHPEIDYGSSSPPRS